MVLASLRPQQFVRWAIAAVAGSAVATQAIYMALGTGGSFVAFGRLVIILLTCILVWLGRSWARWLLLLFGLGALLSILRFVAAIAVLTIPGYLLTLAQIVFVVGVVALFTSRARPHFAQPPAEVNDGPGAAA